MAVTMNVVRWGGLRARAWSNCEPHVGHGSCAINIGDRIPLAEGSDYCHPVCANGALLSMPWTTFSLEIRHNVSAMVHWGSSTAQTPYFNDTLCRWARLYYSRYIRYNVPCRTGVVSRVQCTFRTRATICRRLVTKAAYVGHDSHGGERLLPGHR